MNVQTETNIATKNIIVVIMCNTTREVTNENLQLTFGIKKSTQMGWRKAI